jgi:hypothetical protein
MSLLLKIAAGSLLFGCCLQGNCVPGPTPPPSKAMSPSAVLSVAPGPPMLSVLMWQKFWVVRPGMTPGQVMRLVSVLPMIPARGQRHGWRTLVYTGSLTPAERRALHGKQIEVDVQIVLRPEPVSVSNPPVGNWNPTATGGTIATVSAPYLGDGGALCID